MSDTILRISNVSKSFGGVQVLENVTFDVEKGNRHALIGPNGAGKTTLFNVISGIHEPDEGFIFFEGNDLTHVPSRKRIKNIQSRAKEQRAHVHIAKREMKSVLFEEINTSLLGVVVRDDDDRRERERENEREKKI